MQVLNAKTNLIFQLRRTSCLTGDCNEDHKAVKPRDFLVEQWQIILRWIELSHWEVNCIVGKVHCGGDGVQWVGRWATLSCCCRQWHYSIHHWPLMSNNSAVSGSVNDMTSHRSPLLLTSPLQQCHKISLILSTAIPSSNFFYRHRHHISQDDVSTSAFQ